MSIKENIKSHFSDRDNLRLERIKSTKVVFMFSAFLFFLNLFLVGAKFYEDILLKFIPYTYSLLLLLVYIYLCLLIKHIFGDKLYNLLYFIICFILFIVFIIMLFPFIIDGGIKAFINF